VSGVAVRKVKRSVNVGMAMHKVKRDVCACVWGGGGQDEATKELGGTQDPTPTPLANKHDTPTCMNSIAGPDAHRRPDSK
jgi:hypothetical protein